MKVANEQVNRDTIPNKENVCFKQSKLGARRRLKSTGARPNCVGGPRSSIQHRLVFSSSSQLAQSKLVGTL